MDSNQFMFLHEGTFEPLKNLQYINLIKNPWHCDCSILYLTRYISVYSYLDMTQSFRHAIDLYREISYSLLELWPCHLYRQMPWHLNLNNFMGFFSVCCCKKKKGGSMNTLIWFGITSRNVEVQANWAANKWTWWLSTTCAMDSGLLWWTSKLGSSPASKVV